MSISAEDMASMRLTAMALAHQWLAAREFEPLPADAFAYFNVYPRDLGLVDAAMDGRCIKIAVMVEPRGRLVSGLHVHTNLAVVPALDNLRKGNR